MAFNPRSLREPALKSLVDNLSRHLKAHPLPAPLKRTAIQELVAATLGWPNWHAAIKAAGANSIPKPPVDPRPVQKADIPVSTFRLSTSLERWLTERTGMPGVHIDAKSGQ